MRHVSGRVSDVELRDLARWLSPAQQALFGSMHPADRRHGLDVVAALRAAGRAEPELLLAGLFHDAAKGPSVRLWHRVAWSLGERFGAWIWRVAGMLLPDGHHALERIRDHAERSAELALAAGCPWETAELIRHQAAPRDPDLGRALLLADEAS